MDDDWGYPDFRKPPYLSMSQQLLRQPGCAGVMQ